MALVRERIKTKKQEVSSVLLFVVVFFLGGSKWCFLLCSAFFCKKMLSKIHTKTH